MIADPSHEVCVPRRLSRLWGRSAAVMQPHRVRAGTHLPSLLGVRQDRLYVAGDSDIRLSRYIRGKRAFLSLYTIKMQVGLILLMRKLKIAKCTNTVVRSARFCQKAAHTKGVNSKCEYNSYTRKKLNNQSANRLFSFLYGESLLPSIGIQEIPANDIIRNKSLQYIIFQEFADQEGNHKYSRSKYHSYHSTAVQYLL